VTFISLPNIVSLTLDPTSFLQPGSSSFAQELVSEGLSHALYSFIRRSGRRKSLNRRQMRKTTNRKRRWFVDNIVMHHKRLHDRNRAIVVSNARTRALAKREALKKNPAGLQKQNQTFAQKARDNSPQSKNNLRERARSLRGSVDARRMRARSRWLSVMEEKAA
jgi:hypothetical protein